MGFKHAAKIQWYWGNISNLGLEWKIYQLHAIIKKILITDNDKDELEEFAILLLHIVQKIVVEGVTQKVSEKGFVSTCAMLKFKHEIIDASSAEIMSNFIG